MFSELEVTLKEVLGQEGIFHICEIPGHKHRIKSWIKRRYKNLTTFKSVKSFSGIIKSLKKILKKWSGNNDPMKKQRKNELIKEIENKRKERFTLKETPNCSDVYTWLVKKTMQNWSNWAKKLNVKQNLL